MSLSNLNPRDFLNSAPELGDPFNSSFFRGYVNTNSYTAPASLTEGPSFLQQYGGYIGGGLALGGMLGYLLGGNRSVDLGNLGRLADTAEARYKELMDPNSRTNMLRTRRIAEIAASAQPTLETLYGFSRGAGLSGSTSSSLALAQSRAATARTQEAATKSAEDLMLASEREAGNYLNLAGGIRDRIAAYKQQQLDTQNSFYGQLLKGGLGMLGFLL